MVGSFDLQSISVMCMGEKDVTVIPKETAHFGFHPNGDANTVVPMQELDVYTKNQLPLKVWIILRSLLFL